MQIKEEYKTKIVQLRDSFNEIVVTLGQLAIQKATIERDENYLKDLYITLPINIDIQPQANIYVSRYSNALSKQLRVLNVSSDIIYGTRFGDGSEGTTSDQTLNFIFDHNQGNWYNENT
jgi:hypothetical protein